MSLTLFWCYYRQLHAHFISCSDLFHVSIADLEQTKFRLGSKGYHFKNHDLTHLLFVRNV